MKEREFWVLTLSYERHSREVMFFNEEYARQAHSLISIAMLMPAGGRVGAVIVALEQGEATVCLDRLDMCTLTKLGALADERAIVHAIREARVGRLVKEAQDEEAGGFGIRGQS